METIKLKVRIGSDGLLKIETPTSLRDVETEVVLVLHGKPTEVGDYPQNFFETLDAIEADDLTERPLQPELDVRDHIE